MSPPPPLSATQKQVVDQFWAAGTDEERYQVYQRMLRTGLMGSFFPRRAQDFRSLLIRARTELGAVDAMSEQLVRLIEEIDAALK